MIGSIMANKDQKFYPVQNELLFEASAGTGLDICEVNKGLSGLNRRLYRQNRVYRCKVDYITGNTFGDSVDVYRLRNTFMLQRGYGLAMEEWNRSYEQADEVTREASIGRWRDFRVASTAFLGDTILNPLTLRAQGPKVLSDIIQIDEWNNAFSYTTAGSSRDFGLRTDTNTYGIIHEYDKRGNIASSPSSATVEAAYVDLTADLVDAEVENLQTSGNTPPYDADSSTPDSILEYVGTIYMNADGSGSKLSTGFFDAPLGMVYLAGGAQSANSIYKGTDTSTRTRMFKVVVQKGDYKGVAAHEFVDAMSLGA